MKRSLLVLLSGMVLSVSVGVSPANAFGWPTFDLAEVFNTISSTISQAEAQVSTVMETYSIANIQQAIGDKLGGLQKIKDAKAKIEKAKEKAEKIQKRIQKVKELKEKYEAAAKKAVQDVKDAYSTAQGYVEDVKNQVEDVKNQVENKVNEVKDQVENVKNQVEDVKNQIENKVDEVKGQVGNLTNQANDLFGSDEDNFDFEGNSQSGGNTRTDNSGSSNTQNSAQSGGYTQNNNSGSVNNQNGVHSGGYTQSDNFGFDDFGDEGFASEALGGKTGLSANASVDEIEWGEETAESVQTGSETAINDSSNTLEEVQSNQKDEILKEDAFAGDVIEWGDGTDTSEQPTLLQDKNGQENFSKSVSEKEAVKNFKEISTQKNLNVQEISTPEGRNKVKAFERVSFYYEMKAGYAAASFKTGTDNDGNFYFPDAFAQWVGINFDDNVSEEMLWAGINQICADMRSAHNNETQEYDQRFDYDIIGQMRASAQAHSAVGANESNSTKRVDDLSSMIDVAGGTQTMQLSGLGEIGTSEIHQKRLEVVRESDEIFARFFDGVRAYCHGWPYEEENQ